MKESKQNLWNTLSSIPFLISLVMIYKGYDKIAHYYSSETLTSLNKNSYVGGDAYNYIINSGYATGFFVLAALFSFIGISFVIIGYLDSIKTNQENMMNGNCKSNDENRKYCISNDCNTIDKNQMGRTYDLEFHGYWLESKINNIPSKSGVYCVFESIFDESIKKLRIQKLIYIGVAENIRNEIQNNKKQEEWKEIIEEGNIICFSYAEVQSDVQERVKAALIFKHKPLANTECIDSFKYGNTTINIRGTSEKLIKNFTIERS